MGTHGGPCKHQAAVVMKYGVPSSNLLPQSAETKAALYYMATGSKYILSANHVHIVKFHIAGLQQEPQNCPSV